MVMWRLSRVPYAAAKYDMQIIRTIAKSSAQVMVSPVKKRSATLTKINAVITMREDPMMNRSI